MIDAKSGSSSQIVSPEQLLNSSGGSRSKKNIYSVGIIAER
jgi:hypothetical protein